MAKDAAVPKIKVSSVTATPRAEAGFQPGAEGVIVEECGVAAEPQWDGGNAR